MDIYEIPRSVLKEGPHRVIINSEGEATTSKRAKEEHRIIPDIIFIRNDGWTLGARKDHARVAAELWKDKWQYYVIKPLYEIHLFTDIGNMIYNLQLKGEF